MNAKSTCLSFGRIAVEKIRVFFAIDLASEIKIALKELIGMLQSNYPFPAIRWSDSTQLHITLHFLPAVNISDITTLVSEVSSKLSNIGSFYLEYDTIEPFPTHLKPRILSLSIKATDSLIELTKNVGQGIVNSGYEIEKRPFRGHVTLARISHHEKNQPIEAIKLPRLEKIFVEEIILFQSHTSKKGSIYIPLQRISLRTCLEKPLS